MSKQPDFSKGLVPAIIQDASTRTVLMLGYMNEEAYAKTLAEQRVTFFSRSKNRLWTKGEESGNFLDVVSLSIDCDADTILIQAKPAGPTCHTGADTCFDESNGDNAAWLDQLKHVIRSRKTAPLASSYTASLFQLGTHKIAQKVGEEAVELVIEALMQNDDLFKGEAADLIFHLLVLLEDRGIDLSEIIAVLQSRHAAK
ncbi:bifunctional phosphoribosyl-AMP cyclohydrolase/phosphoribosyl-ATP diphosphatase HisIE [Aquirufa lenticrescens]|uniref:bifunctional phosphoribosyl-AMP cyclohydrolase/phosphoribosyl-ATP diphosphatase HisIE n=1 Tax=Aquirufa lenticrescens TaxID=2696560 RepID=UPI001CAA5E9B|nr:bifunctional phosphoribosyl-AMP cyclohydrolase/phosphoribosyl-ATP diphosphatase HisIE [Aquirufa lenticrescens]UAJ14199.1 bifunctional phosphoribosyl-AMP cyclohydrolase/phosphoribosyl-ATP diphosphatase HisIE [Aquirufa lenticrescens]